MAIVIGNRTVGLGEILALIVLILCIVLFVVGKVTIGWVLMLIGLLALAILL
jgi:hypothetical protein